MRITDIKVAQHLGPFRWCLVRLETDTGLIGHGEAPLGTTVRPEDLQPIKQMLVGARVFDGEPLVERALDHQPSGLLHGVEVALLDLIGKVLGVPVYVLLGGKHRDRVRLYSDSHAGVDWDPIDFAKRVREVEEQGVFLDVYRPEAYARHAREVIARGFTAIKFDIDFPTPARLDRVDRSLSPAELRGIVEVVAAVREAIGPDIDLAIDCHARYHTADALRIAHEMEPFKLLWLEDPVPPRNIDAMAKVTAQARVPICTGEALIGCQEFRELLTRQATDIVQPDTPRAGGLREIKRIAELARLHYIAVGPHNMTSPIGTLAAVHLCASLPNFLALEYHCNGIPWWNDLVTSPRPVLDGGYIQVPETPGLGVEPNEEALRRHLPDTGPPWR